MTIKLIRAAFEEVSAIPATDFGGVPTEFTPTFDCTPLFPSLGLPVNVSKAFLDMNGDGLSGAFSVAGIAVGSVGQSIEGVDEWMGQELLSKQWGPGVEEMLDPPKHTQTALSQSQAKCVKDTAALDQLKATFYEELTKFNGAVRSHQKLQTTLMGCQKKLQEAVDQQLVTSEKFKEIVDSHKATVASQQEQFQGLLANLQQSQETLRQDKKDLQQYANFLAEAQEQSIMA
jgi:hypothetical protein